MNRLNIRNKLSFFSAGDVSDFFLKYRPTMDREYAKSLVGKLIYFTWNRNEKQETSGKVLEYKDGKLRIYTDYVQMLEEDLNDLSDLENNGFIKEILLEDITNIAEFSSYVFEGWEIIPDNYQENVYEITNMQNNTIIAAPYDFDGLYIYLEFMNNGEIERNRYPISLVKDMKVITTIQ